MSLEKKKYLTTPKQILGPPRFKKFPRITVVDIGAWVSPPLDSVAPFLNNFCR